MILAPQGIASGINPQRRRAGHAGRRQTLGHNLLNALSEFWPLNEQSGNRRGLHAGVNLTDTNSVTGAVGVGSLASRFTAANAEYLDGGDSAAVRIGDFDFSFAHWFYFESIGTNPRVFSKRANATNAHDFDCYYTANDMQFEMRDAAGTLASVKSTSGIVGTGSWFFLAVWHDAAADTLNISINNGAAASSATGGIVPNASAAQFRLGELQQVSRPLDGRLQRFGYWKRILDADERAFLYNGGRGRDYPFI